MDKNEQSHKGNALDFGSVLKAETLKIVVYAKTKPHNGRSCIGNGCRCQSIQGEGIGKNIDDQPQ